ncbi:MAG: methyltransferase domain-containing protein [Anaerolineae bacterium]
MPWWASYFDERYLDVFGDSFTAEHTAREAEAIASFIDLPRGARILDLACGQGRHAIALARMGYQVTGLDYSPSLLAHARQAAEAAGADVAWVEGDMRDLPWQDEFDAVINITSAFGYFPTDEENEAVLHQVAKVLKPGGQFLIETMHRDYIVREYQQHDWYETESETLVWVLRLFDAVKGRTTVLERYRTADGNEGERYHNIRVFTATEMHAMLRRAGLAPVDTWGEWDGEAFTFESTRLIVRAAAS